MKKNIAFISEHASPLALVGGVDSGGQNIYVDRVARCLAKMGYKVDIYCRADDPAIKPVVEYFPNIRVVNVQAGPKKFIPKENMFQYMDEFANNMIQFIEKQNIRYDIIHAHFWMSGYVANLVKQILNIPFVITFHALGKLRRIHQGVADLFPDMRFHVEEQIIRAADGIVAECPQDKEDMMIHYYAKEEKMTIIPCGFDKKEFHPIDRVTARMELGLNPDDFIVLQLGRMVPRKGVDNVIRSIGQIYKKKDVNIKLLIVGGESDKPNPKKTPEIGRLLKIAEEENITERVYFVGRKDRNQLKFFYNAADVFVTTPWYEPFGITPLEAMACGTPVIGSNVGGIKYSVAHDKTGFLVPPNEPEILAERILELYNNPILAEQFRNNAIDHVNNHFTWEGVSKDIEKLYAEIFRKHELAVNTNWIIPNVKKYREILEY